MLKRYILSHKFCFSQNVHADTSRKFLFRLLYYRCFVISVNLNQYRETVGVFNNRSIVFCTFCNIWYSHSFRNCSTFIFFNAIFRCAAYLFTLLACLNLILYISTLLLYANRFWLYEVVLKLSGDIEENPRPKPSSKQSLFINHSNLNITFAHNYTRIHIYS